MNDFHDFPLLVEKMVYINKQNSKICFPDMKKMSLRNGVDSVNKASCGLVVYRITTLRDIIFISTRKHSLLFSRYCTAKETVLIRLCGCTS